MIASALEHALNAGFNVIVDNTNLKSKAVKEILSVCEKVGDVTAEEVFPYFLERSSREKQQERYCQGSRRDYAQDA